MSHKSVSQPVAAVVAPNLVAKPASELVVSSPMSVSSANAVLSQSLVGTTPNKVRGKLASKQLMLNSAL